VCVMNFVAFDRGGMSSLGQKMIPAELGCMGRGSRTPLLGETTETRRCNELREMWWQDAASTRIYELA